MILWWYFVIQLWYHDVTLGFQCGIMMVLWLQCGIMIVLWFQCDILKPVWLKCDIMMSVWFQCDIVMVLWFQCDIIMSLWLHCDISVMWYNGILWSQCDYHDVILMCSCPKFCMMITRKYIHFKVHLLNSDFDEHNMRQTDMRWDAFTTYNFE